MFYDATLYMSNSKFVTLSSSIPIAILKGYEKLKTYYSKTDDSHTYAIATSNYIFSIFFCLIYTFYIIVFFNLLCIYSHRFTVQIRLLSETGVGTILY